jgi:transposase-like protein
MAEAIEVVLEEELAEFLGSRRYERSGQRRGYRNGHVERMVTTEGGLRRISVPRARVIEGEKATEFRSAVLPRYARRTREVDETLLRAYLAGLNSRKIRRALGPLLGAANLSKSAISRIVARLKDLFASWSTRDLREEVYPILVFDAIHLKVRLVRRVVSVPVLVVLGADEQGAKRVVALQLATSEAAANWGELVDDLITRGLPSPKLLLSDGHKGLLRALAAWPDVDVQRCGHHKWGNLKTHCPVHAHGELKRDYDAIMKASSAEAAQKAYEAFLAKWSKLCPPVARSLEEAGTNLLTFYRYPRAMWKSLRTTNIIENLNREFRRRTKTQGSFSTEDSAVTLLYGLIAFGIIVMRKIDGYQHMASLAARRCRNAA